MPNYENGKIYKICSYNSDDVYYGSTCLKLCQRLAKHVSNWKSYKKGNTYESNVTSFLILEQGNYYIELVETVPCSSKEELQVREKYWIKNNPCVNYYKNLGRTQKEFKEYLANYYQNNKQSVKDRTANYRKINKDAINAYRREYLLCDCGKYFTRGNHAIHIKTVFHKENINKVMFSQFLDL